MLEIRVPPNTDTAETPYCASPPKVYLVIPGMVAPKFQVQAGALNSVPIDCLLVNVQYG